MFDAGAVRYAQPSVTKVGGITEMQKIAALAEAMGVALMPHSPYFGPGFLATNQFAAAQPVEIFLERFYCDLEASLYGELVDTVDGAFVVPDGPGLGCEPDPDVLSRIRCVGRLVTCVALSGSLKRAENHTVRKIRYRRHLMHIVPSQD